MWPKKKATLNDILHIFTPSLISAKTEVEAYPRISLAACLDGDPVTDLVSLFYYHNHQIVCLVILQACPKHFLYQNNILALSDNMCLDCIYKICEIGSFKSIAEELEYFLNEIDKCFIKQSNFLTKVRASVMNKCLTLDLIKAFCYFYASNIILYTKSTDSYRFFYHNFIDPDFSYIVLYLTEAAADVDTLSSFQVIYKRSGCFIFSHHDALIQFLLQKAAGNPIKDLTADLCLGLQTKKFGVEGPL
ncbi:hypothetical protein nvc1_090 [Namao virus]|nr:hypothetical protein nvc1_090 [Namao virus]